MAMWNVYKSWIGAGIIVLLLSACNSTEEAAPPQQQYSGPQVEIGGVEPRYEPYNPRTSQDYRLNGQTYQIVQNPQNFSQIGLASWYGDEARGNATATGEPFDPNALSAAHPTLPLPSYVRVTNLANSRQIVVRLNDRGPYTPGRIIDLSKAAADRLNISNNTKVRVDFINVAPDGTLSGPGTIGTTVAKQSFALPSRPDIDQSAPQMTMEPSTSNNNDAAVRPLTNPTSTATYGDANNTLPITSPSSRSSGLLGAPQPLAAGVLESSEPVAASSTEQPPALASSAASGSGYLVQVGALSDNARAINWQQKLSQQLGVPGKVSVNGTIYRVQLGPFADRQQAVAIQQRLQSETQQSSFIIAVTQ